jgi:hypothetical protein
MCPIFLIVLQCMMYLCGYYLYFTGGACQTLFDETALNGKGVYVADIESFTMMIAHNAQASLADGSVAVGVNDYQYQGHLYVPNNSGLCSDMGTSSSSSQAPCYITPNKTGSAYHHDYFAIDVLLKAADIPLDKVSH